MGNDFDIDLAGELPPGVMAGTLTGDDSDEGGPADERSAQRETGSPAAGEGGAAPDDPAVGSPPDEIRGDAALEAFEREEGKAPPPKKRRSKKKAAEAKPRRQSKEKTTTTSGTVDRLYKIFQIKTAEVEGNIVPVPVPVTFTIEREGRSEALPGIVARNRDIALTRAAKFFGAGWEGTLVAVPEGMWDPQPVSNVPDNSFSVKIG